MNERAPKTPIDEALQRRISDAMSTDDGLSGDPDLSALLSSNKGASGYAKDLARVNKWLVSWPVPEPSDDAFEALATRIEQRLGETLPGAASTFFGPPDFDDDDATRDATAGLLGPAPRAALPASGASGGLLSAKKGTLVGMPQPGKASAIAPPRSPLAPLKPLAGSATVGASSKPLVARPLGAAPLGAASPLGAKPAGLSPLAKKIAEAKAVESKGEATGQPVKAEPVKAEPVKAEPAKAEPVNLELAAAATIEAKADVPPKPPADPRTTADLPVISSGELELVATPSIPPEAISIPPDAISIPPEAIAIPRSAAVPSDTAAPPPPPAPPSAKKKKRKSKPPPAMLGGDALEDRISIPMPAPIAPLPPPIAPITDLAAARIARDKDDAKRGNWWPMLAAAAVVALAVAGGVTYFGGDRTAAEPMSATATIAPADESESEGVRGGLSSPPMPAAPPAVAMAEPVEAPSVLPATTATTGPIAGGAALEVAEAEVSRMLADDSVARDDYAPRRMARSRSAVGTGGGGLAAGAPAGGTAGPSTGAASGRVASSGSTREGSASTAPSRGGSGDSTPAPPSRPAPTGPLPESPSRDDVRDALEGVRPQVEACFADSHGLAEVVVIAASSGRITTATVSGRFAGTPVGSCIARAVRGARMPPFSNDRFEVHYQYRY
jgi:hypothetical protein